MILVRGLFRLLSVLFVLILLSLALEWALEGRAGPAAADQAVPEIGDKECLASPSLRREIEHMQRREPYWRAQAP